MPTPWHFVLWPERDGQVSQLRRWLTLTPSVRWQAQSHRPGSGPVYQNRFKAFPIEQDEHLSAVRRDVERNPRRAGLVSRAEEGRGSSLADRVVGGEAARWLPPWPVPVPAGGVRWVKEPQREVEVAALRTALGRGRPYGAEGGGEAVVQRWGLQATVRPRGRPPKRRPHDHAEGS